MDRLSEHLGIPPVGDPPDYYRLLGVPRYEPSALVIAQAAQELSSRVRRDQHAFPEESQRLLNAIGRAKFCLATPAYREPHDAALRADDPLHEGSVLAGAPSQRPTREPPEVRPAPSSADVQGADRQRSDRQGAGVPTGEEGSDLSGGSWLIESASAVEPPEADAADEAEWLVGSGPECNFCVRTPWVSRRHCVVQRRNGRMVIADLGSKNGTYLNEVLIDEPMPLMPSDVVSLGKRVWLPWPWPAPGARCDVRVLLVGRSQHNELVLDEDSVSKHHAQLVDDGRAVTLYDLNSRNGTRIGGFGERVGRVEIEPHLPIFFGQAKLYGSELIARCRSAE